MNVHQAAPSLFLALPTEIRLIIYEYALDIVDVQLSHVHPPGRSSRYPPKDVSKWRMGRFPSLKDELALLQTCKTIRREASTIAQRNRRFVFNCGLGDWPVKPLSDIVSVLKGPEKRAARAHMRYIMVRVESRNYYEIDDTQLEMAESLVPLLNECEELEDLVIQTGSSERDVWEALLGAFIGLRPDVLEKTSVQDATYMWPPVVEARYGEALEKLTRYYGE